MSNSTDGPIDLAQFDVRYGASSDELLQMFIDDLPVQIKLIEQAMNTHDLVELHERVHALKGTSATVLANSINQVCRDIEVAIRECDWDGLNDLVRKLHEEFDSTCEYLQKWNRL